MYIDSIEISNYRSIGGNPPLKLDISDINVLSGINDTGKTSALLASFIGLNGVIEGGRHFTELMIGSSHRKGFVSENTKQFIRVDFKCKKEDLEKIRGFMNQNEALKKRLENLGKKGINIEENKVTEFFSNAVISLKMPLNRGPLFISSYDDRVDFELWDESVENFFGYEDLRELSDFLFRIMNSVTELERSVKRMNCLYVPGVTRSNKQTLIEEEDRKSQLVTFFKEICSEKGKTVGKYDDFMKYFRVLLPDLVRIDINITQGDEKSEDIFLTWNQNGSVKEQPLSRSGDGIYNTIFLVAKVLNDFASMNIVFIDEPEIGLHPMLQQRFIKLIRKLSSEFQIQWVLATHSPFILKSLKDKEKLYLMNHDGNQTICQDIDIADKEVVFNTLGAYLPLALAARGVVFVEGQTEVTVLTILLDKVGLNIEREGILIIPLGGENIFKIAAKDLKKLHEKSMVILDSDLQQPEEQGGNIRKVKLSYEVDCAENNVEFVMLKGYRTLENMYPKNILAEVLNRNIENLDHGTFDKVHGITEKNKLKIGELLANKMSTEQAEDFPLIKEIKKWWNEK
ncbi:AAA family ATPase [Bacillus cereus]|nr:AAA family ATPase [Bacillus cereus]